MASNKVGSYYLSYYRIPQNATAEGHELLIAHLVCTPFVKMPATKCAPLYATASWSGRMSSALRTTGKR